MRIGPVQPDENAVAVVGLFASPSSPLSSLHSRTRRQEERRWSARHGRLRPPPASRASDRGDGSQRLRQIHRRGNARRSLGLQLHRSRRLPFPGKQSQDERGHPALRRGPRAVAGVAAGRHPGAAGRRRGRGRELLGAAAQVPGRAPGRRPRLQLQAGGVRRLQGEVRVPAGVGGGDRGADAAEVGGREALHAGEPAAEPARPAAGRRRGGGHGVRCHDGAPRRHRP